ncbi:MAG: anti-sigma factor C-terminal domain-containing protein [Lachnospiraceae bacterium]
MGYEERFKKYLSGELKGEEKEAIEEDMERLEVLLAFMDKKLDEGILEGEAYGKPQTEERQRTRPEGSLGKAVSRAVNRKLRRYAAITGAAVLVLVLMLVFSLSPVLDMIYYNPAKTQEVLDEVSDSAVVYQPFQLSLAVYMELFCGEKGFSAANIREEGYGRYTIDVYTHINGEVTHHLLDLVRNHLYRQDPSWNVSDIPGNAFTHYYKGDLGCSIAPQEAEKRLEKLPETFRVRAALSFSELKDIEELSKFMDKYEAQYLYVPIEIQSAGFAGYWGFTPKAAGYVSTDLYSKEEYPYLDLFQYEGEGSYPPDVLTQHVTSMLRFMLAEENKKFLEIFDSSVPGENVADPLKYEEALKYVEENGVNGYGVVVSASKEQLLAMLKDSSIDGVYMFDSTLDLN